MFQPVRQDSAPPRLESAARADVEHRLHNERMLAAEVGSHPSIVAALDGGRLEDGGAPFVVTERVHGPELSYVIATERRIEPLRACRLALDIADGLAALHARGIAHRDVKPDNILVVTERERTAAAGERPVGAERAKLIDFGLATRIVGFGDARERVTLASERPGTPMYMSPEQSMGAGATAAFDVYGLGVTLYEMLAGVTPFVGVPEAELLEYKVHRHSAMDLLAARADLPASLAPLVKGCLAPVASDRLGLGAVQLGLRALLGLRRAHPERHVEVTELGPRAGAIEVVANAAALEVVPSAVALEVAAEVVADVVPETGYRHDEATAAAIAFADAMPKGELEARRVWDRETVEKLRLAAVGRQAEAAAAAAAALTAEAAAESSVPTADVAVAPVAPVGPSRAELLLQIHAPDPEVRAEADLAEGAVVEDGPRSGRWIAAGLVVAVVTAVGGWLWLRRGVVEQPTQGRTEERGGVGASLVADPPVAADEATAEGGAVEVVLPGPAAEPVAPAEAAAPAEPVAPAEAAADSDELVPSGDSSAEVVPKATPRKPEVAPKPAPAKPVPAKPVPAIKPEVPKPAPAKPDAPASDPSTTPDCEHARRAAETARAAVDWSAVLVATRRRDCWSDAGVRTALRVRAFGNLGRWQECVDAGAKSTDDSVRRQAEACRKQFEKETEQP
jgi:serine/threonine-protein kinase